MVLCNLHRKGPDYCPIQAAFLATLLQPRPSRSVSKTLQRSYRYLFLIHQLPILNSQFFTQFPLSILPEILPSISTLYGVDYSGLRRYYGTTSDGGCHKVLCSHPRNPKSIDFPCRIRYNTISGQGSLLYIPLKRGVTVISKKGGFA